MESPKTGLRRQPLDKFYTKPSIVNLCVEYIKKTILINIDDLIIEPSAGNGASDIFNSILQLARYFFATPIALNAKWTL